MGGSPVEKWLVLKSQKGGKQSLRVKEVSGYELGDHKDIWFWFWLVPNPRDVGGGGGGGLEVGPTRWHQP